MVVMNSLSPIVVFTYKRVDTLRLAIESLLTNPEAVDSPLIIYSDGPKSESDRCAVEDVRSYLRSLKMFPYLELIFQKRNVGLADSVIDGVSDVLRRFDKVIVIEDDLILSSNFLSFMNASLIQYENDKRTASISGFCPIKLKSDTYKFDAFYSRRVTSWGWATWKDRWAKVDWDINALIEQDINRAKGIRKLGSDLYPMIRRQMNGEIDSWAIRWFYHHFVHQKYAIVPIISKVTNIGFGKEATHTKREGRFRSLILDVSNIRCFKFPDVLDKDNEYFLEQHIRYYSYINRICRNILTRFAK